MKILVPTDFSDNADKALDFALKISKINGASITLLYAYYGVYDFAAQAAVILDQLEKDANESMEKLLASPEFQGVKVDSKIIHGTVATAVTSTAYREDYDLIVMGTQGASGIKKVLIGSNTAHVIKDSQVPVLAVPTNSSYSDLREITVAVELHHEDEKFFHKMFKLTQKTALPYEILHVDTDEGFEKSLTLKGLMSYLGEKYPDEKFTHLNLKADNLQKGLEKYLKDIPHCLLVMFSKQKSFFEYIFNKSASMQMAYHTHVPLLVIK
ncbi:universal stress protein [Pararhodonellum marinum]|uniref:universal stress protein n=1 Tax=Pararhodonellum marinum TaxID=2755358 RepID=UPI00189049DE|nr:universal stress protein [Pararhodonellum marinum]